jgi:rhodanese-related sulfurtransferase
MRRQLKYRVLFSKGRIMASLNSISVDKLSRLIGTAIAPVLIDVRTDENFSALPTLVPGAIRRSHAQVPEWGLDLHGRSAVVIGHTGSKLSHGVAAWLRHQGAEADVLEGGASAWAGANLPMVPEHKLPPRDGKGRTVWVTRARPKVDRIGCPWLIRRFVDPDAVFLFVAPGEVAGVAERFGAAPFDVEGVFWSHRGELCTFDVMVEDLRLSGFPALNQLALIVRGADTGRPDIAPQAAGLLAISLGLSRAYQDDLEQLEAGMAVYDGLYRWCRDAKDETHDWVSHAPRKGRS